ncbi:uncharacterized protein LOC117541262 [Gymnodraco acuticeps]|uniref:Uncharacterized protein LOC117541262 n=1 Tax=Gymnodraco acuticeps TaxID=8218 RepID=A0A6P8TJW8_GYMAC|nr:uncharacterized protein LOC117541262 [Gymnodraco acuticeps]
MDEFKRIKMSLFLVLLLQFTGAEIGQHLLILSVRAGDEATLQCNYVIHDQDECDGTSWLSSDSVILVGRGQIGNHAKSDRLRVTEKCSLVIKKVTEEDAGRYTCRQFRSGPEQEDSVSQVLLFVDTSEDTAAAATTTTTTTTESDSRSGFPTTASVITEDSTGEDTATTTTTTTESDSRSGFTTTASVITEDATGWWWWIIVVIVAVAALTIITVAVSRRKRTQGQKPQTDENIVRYGVDDGTVNYENIRPPDGV